MMRLRRSPLIVGLVSGFRWWHIVLACGILFLNAGRANAQMIVDGPLNLSRPRIESLAPAERTRQRPAARSQDPSGTANMRLRSVRVLVGRPNPHRNANRRT